MQTFFKLHNSVGQVFIQSKKSPLKSNSFRRESISKLPGGMALVLGLKGIYFNLSSKGEGEWAPAEE